jgi:hypothetical protein
MFQWFLSIFTSTSILVVTTWGQDEKAPAHDIVKLKGSRISYRGTILKFDEEGITLKWMPRGDIKDFSHADIEEVRTQWAPGYEEGKKAIDAGEYQKGVGLLKSALTNENRTWAKDLIRSEMLRGLQAIGDLNGSASIFVEVASVRKDAAILAFAPIRWMKGEPLSENQHRLAKAWVLHGEAAPVKLLGANWLLSSPDRDLAKQELTKLVTDPDSRIRPLARAILLTDQLEHEPARISSETLLQFKRDVAGLPASIRMGPQYVLATAYEKAELWSQAALAYLYVPFVSGGPPEIQADALLRGAVCTEKAGFQSDARIIFSELAERFPKSTAFRKAQQIGKIPKENPRTP